MNSWFTKTVISLELMDGNRQLIYQLKLLILLYLIILQGRIQDFRNEGGGEIPDP